MTVSQLRKLLAILPDDMPAALYLWGDQDEPQEGIGGQ